MQQEVARIDKLHPAALAVVEQYTKLAIGGKYVIVPYFMNNPGRKGRRVRVGKGTPQELERETVRLAKRYMFDLAAATPEEIRSFMIAHRLGIDCSGLVAWISHELAIHRTGRPLWRSMQFTGHPLRAGIRKRLRPIENISAKLLTDDRNAITVRDLKEVRPGDIIRSLNGNHVLLITEICYDKRDNPLSLRYVNSTEYDGVKYGLRYGVIAIIDPTTHILEQEWIDGENGINWIFEAANNFPDDTRIVRLKVFDELD
jgi:hypothetical protein